MQERTQLGTDLHDSTIQTLYAAGLNLSAVEQAIKTNHPDQAEQLKELRRNLQISVDDLRWFIHNLETEVSPHSFHESIDSMLSLLRNTNQCQITSRIDKGVADPLSVEQRINLLQILREAVSNALRHSQAQRIQVSLQRQANLIKLRVEDDGVGMPSDPQNSTSLGISNMRYRARQANALLTIKSTVGSGTCVSLTFTLA
jgi:signal transduction histidine kinase